MQTNPNIHYSLFNIRSCNHQKCKDNCLCSDINSTLEHSINLTKKTIILNIYHQYSLQNFNFSIKKCYNPIDCNNPKCIFDHYVAYKHRLNIIYIINSPDNDIQLIDFHTKNYTDIKDIKDIKDIGEIEDIKDIKEIGDIKEIKEIMEIKEIGDIKEIKEIERIEEIEGIGEIEDIEEIKEIERIEEIEGIGDIKEIKEIERIEEIKEIGDIKEIKEIGRIEEIEGIGEIERIEDIEEIEGIGEIERIEDIEGIGEIERIGDIGDIGEIGEIGEIERIGDIGDIGEIGEIGEIERIGDIGEIVEIKGEKSYSTIIKGKSYLDTVKVNIDSIDDNCSFTDNIDKIVIKQRELKENISNAKDIKSKIKKFTIILNKYEDKIEKNKKQLLHIKDIIINI